MASTSSMLRTIGCIALFHRLSVAADQQNALPLARGGMVAFAFNRQSSCQRRPRERGPSELQALFTGRGNPPQGLVADFSLGRGLTRAGSAADRTGDDDANDPDETVRKRIARKIVRPPTVNGAPRSAAEKPAHTALARVVASQRGVDLSSVAPSTSGGITAADIDFHVRKTSQSPRSADGPPAHTTLARMVAVERGVDLSSVLPRSSGGKITAPDVYFHVWKMSQPPCTAEGLELAHSLGLDLNDLYDGEELQVSDVKLYQENAKSLNMSTQVRRVSDVKVYQENAKVSSDLEESGTATSEDARKPVARPLKMSAVTPREDNRIEWNIRELPQNAIELTEKLTQSIVRQVRSAA